MQILDSDALEWIGVRFLDPIGRVFYLDGLFYRAIYPDALVKWREIEELQRLFEHEDLVVPAHRTDFQIDGYAEVVCTKSPTFLVKAQYWTFEDLRSASLKWIKINQELLTNGMGLADAHLGNFALFEKCNVLWVDHGSIAELEKPMMGFREFSQCQLFPLLLASRKRGLMHLARYFLVSGMTLEEARAIGAVSLYSLIIDYLVQGIQFGSRAFPRVFQRFSKESRAFILTLWKRQLSNAKFKYPKGAWSKYRTRVVGKHTVESPSSDPRDEVVVQLLKERNPKTLLDVGANDGYFSALALNSTDAVVLAVDTDEGSMHKMHQWITGGELSFSDRAMCCTGTFFDLPYQAEMVLALALVHHISIANKFKFDVIAEKLAGMSTKSLLVEFMPNGMGGVQGPEPNPLPVHYRLEYFTNELKLYFKDVVVLDYERPSTFSPRTMIVCDVRK